MCIFKNKLTFNLRKERAPKTNKPFHNKKSYLQNMHIVRVFVLTLHRSEICERVPHCPVKIEITLSEVYKKKRHFGYLCFFNTGKGISCGTFISAFRNPGVSWTTV